MMEVRETEIYAKGFRDLNDQHAKGRILARIRRLELFGHAGDTKSVSNGVQEMRVDCGPGYRLYFTNRDRAIVILLCGGTKKRQDDDIKEAKRLAGEL
jgi:putative addiction module killer protein